MQSINDKYIYMLNDLYTRGETRFPRGLECREIRPYVFRLDNPNDNLITIPGVATNLEYAKEELNWYLSATRKIDYSDAIKRVWEKYSDDGVGVNSNYGERIFGRHSMLKINQWDWVKEKLSSDGDSRQAVINLNSYFDKEKDTKDFPCTMDMQFFRIGYGLELIVHMRSNDVFKGFRNDVYCFTELQKLMALELDLDLGPYTHLANSMHLYKNDFKKVEDLKIRLGD